MTQGLVRVSVGIEDPADLDAALRAAIDTPGPTLVDIIAQPLQEAAAPVSEWIA